VPHHGERLLEAPGLRPRDAVLLLIFDHVFLPVRNQKPPLLRISSIRKVPKHRIEHFLVHVLNIPTCVEVARKRFRGNEAPIQVNQSAARLS
jgi:hypothetical protein